MSGEERRVILGKILRQSRQLPIEMYVWSRSSGQPFENRRHSLRRDQTGSVCEQVLTCIFHRPVMRPRRVGHSQHYGTRQRRKSGTSSVVEEISLPAPIVAAKRARNSELTGQRSHHHGCFRRVDIPRELTETKQSKRSTANNSTFSNLKIIILLGESTIAERQQQQIAANQQREVQRDS